jgi:TolB-like protein/class 3 adenylate cyclase
MTAARRLAAILAVDVAGYSRLMGEDEAGTAKIVRERRNAATPLVRGFGGRLVKTTGDGVLLEFPSIVSAVECAILIQKMMAERNAALPEAKRILYRIGVNLGDVLIEGDDILGDGVNIAARLEGICEPGGVLISGSAYEHVRGRIEADFADLGEQSLKNIMKPVRAYALPPDAIAAAKVDAPERASSSASPAPVPEKREPPRLSLVVLPFANIGEDPEQDYFVDGVTESLTTDLSRISGAFVIGRSTAFTYKGKAVDLKQIGRELNVRYVLEGSVRRAVGRMRVNVQLIEAETGAHLWAERFDKPIADLLDMQDEIVSRLANQLRTELIAAEARRAERAPNPDSMDLHFQGRAVLMRGASADLLAKARGFFERALAADPSNVGALVGVANADLADAWSYQIDDPRPLMAAAEMKLSQALAAAPNHAVAHWAMGGVLCATNRAARGIDEFQRALAIDPNFALARGAMAMAHIFIGRAEETEGHVLEALRLSPRDAVIYLWFLHVGGAKACLGEYETAVAWLRKSIDANRNNPLAFFFLAACLARLGRLDEARRELNAGLAANPKFTIRRFLAARESDNPVYVAQYERIAEGMRLAGAPEG